MKINTSKYGFSFFLSGKKAVSNLEVAAKQYGGATLNLDTGEQYSNIPGGEFIQLKPGRELNTVSLFVPSTENVYRQADRELIKRVVSVIVQRLYQRFETFPRVEKGLGSWQTANCDVIYDNLQIVSVFLENITEADIKFFVHLGKYIKREMSQEAVSLGINDALALV